MKRSHPLVPAAVLAAVWALLAVAGLARQGVFLAKHEGDAVHLMDILLRMGAGQRPHLDFLTPIGDLAFWPIVWLMNAGIQAGHAFVLAQVVIGFLLGLAAWWVGVRRLAPPLAIAFGVIVLVLCMAFVHGEAEPTLSVSMHYNRWAWAVTFIVIALAMLPPPSARGEIADGVLIGTGAFALILLKMTYAAALAPGVLIVLIARRAWKTLTFATVAFGLLAVAVTLFWGFAFWPAYLRDLLIVATSDIRSSPGLPLRQVIADPAYMGGSLAALAGIILLRQSGEKLGGLAMLLFFPGFIYITFQNFGNDPQWLYVLPILLLALRPSDQTFNAVGWNLRRALGLVAVFLAALAAPSFLNLAYSPFRHLAVPSDEYGPVLFDAARHDDVRVPLMRGLIAAHVVDETGPGRPYEAYAAEFDDREPDPGLDGMPMPRCALQPGMVAYFDAVASDLETNGNAGARIFATDVLTGFWMYGDFPPLPGGAPWSYGSLAGLGAADVVLVPNCPVHRPTRRQLVEKISNLDGWRFEMISERPLYSLYSVIRP
ncbi:MAG: hypothetical protein AAF667_00080 [Pseudomonadota bacterium]